MVSRSPFPLRLLVILPTLLAALGACILPAAAVFAQGTPPDLEAEDEERDKGHFVEITPAVEAVIAKGLQYLADSQNEDGSWTANVGFKLNYSYQITTRDGRHIGVTSLALMAFLAGGHLPGVGKYGDTVRKGLEFVLLATRDTDGFITFDGSRMYSHAFATLLLAEIYGMSDDAELRELVRDKLELAIKLIVECQNAQGAWRYVPYAIDSDMSITVCQLQALRAARNVGVRVPKETIDRAIKYVQSSAKSYGGQVSSFNYQIDRRSTRTSFALTAAGVTSLHSAGVYNDKNIEPALRYLWDNKDSDNFLQMGYYFFWYGHYYAVQAMFQRGGTWWERWWNYISTELVRNQNSKGTWPDLHKIGEPFSTAVATLILQVPYRYLPILQR